VGLLVVVQFAFVNGCSAAIQVLGPLLAKQYLGGAPAWGAIQTAAAVGLVSGSLVAIRLRPRFPLRIAVAATFGFLPPFFLLAFRAPAWLIAAAMLLDGVCEDIFEVLWSTSLQNHLPNEALARISSYDMLGSFALGPLGLGGGRPAGRRLGRAADPHRRGSARGGGQPRAVAVPAVRGLPAAPPPAAGAPEPPDAGRG
jgi:Transmembrane secretion effector